MELLINHVLRHELAKIAHRRRTFFYRTLLLLALCVVVLLGMGDAQRAMARTTNPTQVVAELGTGLFYTLIVFTWIAVVFAAPTLASGLITEEKERQTLPLLLVTGLTDFQIVYAKVMAGIVVIGLTVLGYVPIVFLCLLFGGVSWYEVIAEFGVLIGLLAFCCGVGVYFSSACPNTVTAVGRARGTIILALIAPPTLLVVASFVDFGMGVEPEDGITMILFYAMCFINPIFGAIFVKAPIPGGPTGIATVLRLAWIPCVLICIGLFLLFCRLAARKMADRESVLKVSQDPPRLFSRGRKLRDRPTAQVWDNPVMWRAWHSTRGLHPAIFVGFALLFLVIVPLLVYLSDSSFMPLLSNWIYHWVTIMVEAVVLCAFLTEKGASSITPEREKQTLPLLLLTDLEAREIIGGKALGILLRARGLILLPLAHAALICVFRFTGWITLVLLFLDLLAFGGFVFACSLFVSMHARKTSRAILWSQFVLLFIAFLMPMVLGLILWWWPHGERCLFLYPGLWAATSVHPLDDAFQYHGAGIAEMDKQGGTVGYAACLVLYALMALLFYWAAVRRFETVARKDYSS